MPLCTCTLRPVEAVFFQFEIGTRATLTTDAVLHRHAGQLAIQAVAPLVIRADEDFRVAEFLLAKLRAHWRSAVSNVDTAVAIAHHDHRPFADQRLPVITSVRYLALSATQHQWSIEEGLHLALVETGASL